LDGFINVAFDIIGTKVCKPELNKEVIVPQIKLNANPAANWKQLVKCKLHERYCQIIAESRDFASYFFALTRDEYFDMPSAARKINGLLDLYNRQATDYAWSTYATLDNKNKNLVLMFGCSEKVLNEVLEKPIATDDFDIHLGGNMIDILLPKYAETNLTKYI
jgi:hypothetical protein